MAMTRNETMMDSRSARRLGNETRNEHYKTSGSGGGPEYSARWKFTTRPIKVHFQLPADLYQDPYEPALKTGYRRLIRHYLSFLNHGKGGFLECGGAHCVTDAYLNPAEFGLNIEPDRNLRKSHKLDFSYAISGVIEEWFHLVEESNPKTNKTYMTRVLCEGRGCKYCAQLGPKSRVFGRRSFFTFSQGAWNYEVMSAVEHAEKFCRCGGQIYIPEYLCPHCGNQLIDVATSCEVCTKQGSAQGDIELDLDAQTATCKSCNSTWSLLESEDPSLRKAVDAKYDCNCGKQTYAQPRQVCTNCEAPNPLTIFDLQLTICKDSDSEQAKTKIKKWEVKEMDPRLFDPKFQGSFDGANQNQTEAAEAAAQRMTRPVDLDKLFTIESTRQQAAKLNKPDPFSGTDAAVGQEQSFANNPEDHAEQYSE